MVNYQIKVKSNVETYLWGSSDIAQKPMLESDHPMILIVRVDEYGESIVLNGTTISGTSSIIGTLGRDEIFSVSLKLFRAVSVKCVQANVDSRVHCTLLSRA